MHVRGVGGERCFHSSKDATRCTVEVSVKWALLVTSGITSALADLRLATTALAHAYSLPHTTPG